MRPSASTLILFALSGIAAAAFAGVVGALLTAVAVIGPAGVLSGLIFVAAGAVQAIPWAAIPAMLVGGTLWSLGGARPRLRRRWPWAAAGALTGLAFLPFPWPAMVDDVLRAGGLRAPSTWVPLVFALAGAAGALAFRATMQLLSLFAADDADA